MKNLYVLILVFIITLTCKSQGYVPIPDSNAVWKVVEYTNPPQYYSDHYEYFTDGDTLIYDTLYTKIRKIEYNVFCSLDTLSNVYAGAFRNDTENQKVYYIPAFPPVKHILYDFSLNVGDTVPDSFQNVLYPFLSVKNIDTVYINSEPRKRFKYWEGPAPEGFQFFVYEGIGSDFGLLEEYGSVENYRYLKCFHNNDFLEYIHPGDTTCNLRSDTCINVNTLEINNPAAIITIYPNPCDNYIIINNTDISKNGCINLYVYNIFGSIVIHQILCDLENNLDMTDIKPGVYLLVISQNGINNKYKLFKK